jgi:hypothetical protein
VATTSGALVTDSTLLATHTLEKSSRKFKISTVEPSFSSKKVTSD